ncbi:MAG: hypothetical protein AAB575_02115 [Patescibacteria group bacterium]
MLAKILILVVLILIVALIGSGVALIAGWWQPQKDASGNVVPLSGKEKVGVGVVVVSVVVGFLTLLLSSEHPWVKKIKGVAK